MGGKDLYSLKKRGLTQKESLLLLTSRDNHPSILYIAEARNQYILCHNTSANDFFYFQFFLKNFLLLKIEFQCQLWQLMLLISALSRHGQVNFCEFGARLVYKESSRVARAVI